MTQTTSHQLRRRRYHQNAYQFVFHALRYTQERLQRKPRRGRGEEREAHITARELLEGIRELAVAQFGLMAKTVFDRWGVRCTDDFGRIVFDLIDRGEMRKTDRDRLSDFSDVFDFDEAFDHNYRVDTRNVFQ